jgi:CheY-like chemotaxis protein
MKILLAEDDPTTRLILKKKLEELEHEVMEYKNGKEAWEGLQEGVSPQVAIIDWEMPEMNGIELVERIRTDDRIRSMYLIMLTIRDQNRDVMDCFQIGVDDYLSKPLELRNLKLGLEKGKKIIRSGLDFNDRQDIIMDNIYDFFEGKGRLEKKNP